ncbi:TcdA/TcdB catalytic glycosyltransferase domain-containing protein [Candidatus Fukatsuia symbiotica]|uniref:TcdA/TcdB catalytic glycosyltransferase domain-containing protein n=2 Tax=Yersiniaceae TaxID=1903411 RepID=UPI0009321CBC|nr:TcdA/TcdB catalytic glycosyltransferase domain-containing protein [Candidatus Fukatsuia symbiotica]MEA9445356.1 TcdA/TcdB catalytic glycosyltransferase domain-containing protein [Candidatus Fukatsuia symbiotica]
MPNLELAKEIDNFLSQNFFILTKPDENELIAALVEYTVMSKREVLPKYEMEALSRILYWAVKCNYYPFYKSKLLNIIKQHIAVLSETVPPKIHFMSLIGFEAIQLDYINLWIQENAENNTINIWTDSTTLLAEELSTRIEEVAVRHARNGKYTSKQAFRSELIMWQNKACNSIINTMLHNDPAQDGNKKFCFDQAVIIFLEEEGLAKPGELAEIRQTHTERFNSAIQQLKQTTRHPDNVTFIDFHSLNYLPGYFLYLKELVLRGNPVTALDVSRLLILKDQGGLYLDTDLLPCLNEIIFSRLIATHSSNTAHQYSPEVIMQVVLDELTHRGSMPGRAAVIKNTNRGDYPNPLQIIDESARQYIKNVVISALDSGQSLFSPLGRLAVDPYFACSYSGDNNKAIVAAKGSEFIDQILIYIAQIHKVMRRHNIDGLDPDQPIPREINRKIAEDLQTNKLFPDSRSLFAYREGGPYSADIPNRLAPYRHAYTLLMKEAGVVADNRIQPSLHKTIPPFRRAFFSTEEAYLSRLRERGGRFPCDLFRQNSQYDSQYIIQLQDDEEVSQMARFLYNKNADRTAHYCYQAQTNTLAIVNAAPDFVFHGKTRIIFISHGIFMKAMGGEKIVQLLITRGLLQKDTTGDFQKIDRVSIAACYINEATPANVVMNRPIQDENFIENIYRAFSIEKISVGSISVREKLVLIDALGRTWTGLIKNPQIPEEQWQVDWTLVKESNRKIIFTQGEDGEIVKTRIGLLKEASARTRLLKTSYNGRFGVDDVFDGYQTKLSGAINVKIARQIVENIKKGPVLMVADIMALIAGMCEEVAPHRIIINANRPDMTALQHILRQTEQYHDYIHWLNELDLWGGTKELKLLMEKLFTQPQTAFLRLKERYLHDDFDLFSLNLSDPASAGIIERDKRDKAPIRSIYLGQVEQHFGETIKESLAYNDDPETSLKKMKTSIDNIEQNLKKLSKGEGNTSLYYHSELTRQSEQATINNSKLKRKYTSPRYLIKAQVYYANTLSAHSYRMVIDHCDALVSANRNLLTQNHLETNKWGCLLSTLTYNKEIQQYEMYYLHQDKMQKIQLTTDNTIFAEMRRYLEQQHERLIKCYQRVNGRLYPNPFFSTTVIL